jgi:hypothetical protein
MMRERSWLVKANNCSHSTSEGTPLSAGVCPALEGSLFAIWNNIARAACSCRGGSCAHGCRPPQPSKEHNVKASDAPFGSFFSRGNVLGHISKSLLALFDIVFHSCYIPSMEWDIEFTDEFERWWNDLSEDEQDSVDQMVRLLQMRGPSLGRPHADLIQSSRHSNMKELRVRQAVSCAICFRSETLCHFAHWRG